MARTGEATDEAKREDAAPVASNDDDGEKRRWFPRRREKRPKKRGLAHQLLELPLLVLFAFVIAVLIKTFLVQAFFIPSSSMAPTLHVRDRVLVEKVTYLWDEPSRGDVVVFARSVFGRKPPELPWHEDVRTLLRELLGLPTGKEEDYIKRVVAVGGDSVRYEGRPRTLYVNGEKVEEGYLKRSIDRSSGTLTVSDCSRLGMEAEDGGCRVPAGMVFVMGDNRTNSADSRDIGPVKEDKIVGRGFVIIWPFNNFGGL